jgi:tRNA modification GTPase
VRIAREADGLLIVVDASRGWSAEDERIVRRYRSRNAVLVMNKTDLPEKTDRKKVRAIAGAIPVVEVSALKGKNIDALRQAIRDRFIPRSPEAEEIVLHARQQDRLQEALEALRRAESLMAGRHSEEVPAEEIRAALTSIGELTGEVRAGEVLEEIFGRFCVGK